MKRIVCLLLLCAGVFSVSAQDVYNSSGQKGGYKKKQKKEGYDPDKLVLGGGLNLGYSGDYANVGISPKVGYKLNDYITVGVGLGYQYYRSPFDVTGNFPGKYINDNIIFPGIWVKSKIWGPFFAAADLEFDIISEKSFDVRYDVNANPYLVNYKVTVTAPCALVGLGYKYQLGGRVSATAEVMYDVIQADYSPYRQQLVYRAGIFVGL